MKAFFLLCLVALFTAACTVQPDGVSDGANGARTITGLVTAEGVECPAVRGDDGTLYTIAGGNRETLREGTRVRITGTVAEMSFCMQGTTISASKIEVLP